MSKYLAYYWYIAGSICFLIGSLIAMWQLREGN